MTLCLSRYHGGKARLAGWIVGQLPPHRVYVDLFGGAASVLLNKPRSYAEIYNDLDGAIHNLVTVMADPVASEALRLAASRTLYHPGVFEAARHSGPDAGAVPWALAVLVRMQMGRAAKRWDRSTGFRRDSHRSGSTPARDWQRWPNRVPELYERLRGVGFDRRDFADVIDTHDSAQTLFYADPPYDPATRSESSRLEGYAHDLAEAGHRRLAERLRRVRGMVVLSGYDGPLYRELFGDWARLDRRAHADGARERVESLWFNAAAWAAREGDALPLFAAIG